VRSTVESLGGRVEIETARGHGTATTLVVPIAAAVQRVLLFGVGSEIVAVPIARVERILEIGSDAIERSGPEAFALIDDEPMLVIELAARLGLASPPLGPRATLALCEMRGQRVALVVERLAGQQEIYVKPVPKLLAGVRALAGLTVLGSGDPVFLLDLHQLQ
jgi:two-component system chemotaxis sensor kinase CheA